MAVPLTAQCSAVHYEDAPTTLEDVMRIVAGDALRDSFWAHLPPSTQRAFLQTSKCTRELVKSHLVTQLTLSYLKQLLNTLSPAPPLVLSGYTQLHTLRLVLRTEDARYLTVHAERLASAMACLAESKSLRTLVVTIRPGGPQIGCTPSLSNKFLDALLRHCTTLRSLHLEGFPGLTGPPVDCLQHCSSLTSLVFRCKHGGHWFTPRTGLSLHLMPQLRTLELSGVLPWPHHVRLSTQAPHLTELRCSITKYQLPATSHTCEKMTALLTGLSSLRKLCILDHPLEWEDLNWIMDNLSNLQCLVAPRATLGRVPAAHQTSLGRLAFLEDLTVEKVTASSGSKVMQPDCMPQVKRLCIIRETLPNRALLLPFPNLQTASLCIAMHTPSEDLPVIWEALHVVRHVWLRLVWDHPRENWTDELVEAVLRELHGWHNLQGLKLDWGPLACAAGIATPGQLGSIAAHLKHVPVIGLEARVCIPLVEQLPGLCEGLPLLQRLVLQRRVDSSYYPYSNVHYPLAEAMGVQLWTRMPRLPGGRVLRVSMPGSTQDRLDALNEQLLEAGRADLTFDRDDVFRWQLPSP